MNKNSGFTLVELLAIIVILAVIIAIAAPNMTKQISKSEQEKNDVFNKKIDNAAHLYVAKYYANEIVSDTYNISFTLNDLIEDGLITIKDNKCKSSLNNNNDNSIIVSKDDTGNIYYNYCNISKDDCYISKDDDCPID